MVEKWKVERRWKKAHQVSAACRPHGLNLFFFISIAESSSQRPSRGQRNWPAEVSTFSAKHSNQTVVDS